MIDDQYPVAAREARAASSPASRPASTPVSAGLGPRGESQKLLSNALGELRGAIADLKATNERERDQPEALIEAHRSLEIELEIEFARFRQLFWLAPHAYVVTDGEGIIQDANLAVAALLGVAPNRLAGKSLSRYVTVDERRRFRERLSGAVTSDGSSEWETTVRRWTGDAIQAKLRVSVARDVGTGDLELRWLIRALVPSCPAGDPRPEWWPTSSARGEGRARTEERFHGVLEDLRNPVRLIMEQIEFLAEQVMTSEQMTPLEIVRVLTTVGALAADTVHAIDEVHDALDLQLGRPLALDRCSCDLLEVALRVVSRYRSTTECCP